jgi:hypothetical protein
MKVNTRSVPKDEVSVEEKGRRIHIFTHRQTIVLVASDYDSTGDSKHMTFDQLYKWIQENAE